LEDIQQLNLVNNYNRFKDSKLVIACQQDDSGLGIEYHPRSIGQGVFYVVVDGMPVAYCAGYWRPSRGRPMFTIQSTFVGSDSRRLGVCKTLYKLLVHSGIVMISDTDRSPIMLHMWGSLKTNCSDVRVISLGQQDKLVSTNRAISKLGIRNYPAIGVSHEY